MARVAFTDFSGLEPLKASELLTRTYFFIETPSVLEPINFELPPKGVMLNGQLVEFRTHLKQEDGGWNAEVEVCSETLEPNSSLAEFYFNQTLDLAALKHASPFQIVSKQEYRQPSSGNYRRNATTSAVITVADLDQCTRLAFLLYTLEGDLLRSIGWYRRGLSSPDTLLAFLGLWNSIEVAAARFCEKNEHTAKGTKNQIFQLLTDYLPKCGYQFFKPQTDELNLWITSYYDMRLEIAHGLGSTDLNTFQRSESMIPRLRQISTALLRVLTDTRCKENEMIVQAITHAEATQEAYKKEAIANASL